MEIERRLSLSEDMQQKALPNKQKLQLSNIFVAGLL